MADARNYPNGVLIRLAEMINAGRLPEWSRESESSDATATIRFADGIRLTLRVSYDDDESGERVAPLRPTTRAPS